VRKIKIKVKERKKKEGILLLLNAKF